MTDKTLAQNRRATHRYTIERRLEAGIELTGGEVKSIKAGNASIAESYVQVRRGEAWLIGAYVKPYGPAGESADPTRARRLLLHQNEISTLIGESKAGNRTIVPTKIYLKQALIKVEIALGQGKKTHDKRESLKRRQAEREAERAIRRSQHS